MDVKRFFENSTSLTLHQGSENLKIPIIGSKIKVVVNFIYGYQNLSGEKYKTILKKTRAQSGLRVKRKIQKSTRNVTFLTNYIFGWFVDFSLKPDCVFFAKKKIKHLI